jgi:hypothetical protein
LRAGSVFNPIENRGIAFLGVQPSGLVDLVAASGADCRG